MDAFKRIIAVYLIAVGAIVAIHTIIEPLYYTSTETDPYQPVAKSGFLGFMFFSNAGVEMA